METAENGLLPNIWPQFPPKAANRVRSRLLPGKEPRVQQQRIAAGRKDIRGERRQQRGKPPAFAPPADAIMEKRRGKVAGRRVWIGPRIKTRSKSPLRAAAARSRASRIAASGCRTARPESARTTPIEAPIRWQNRSRRENDARKSARDIWEGGDAGRRARRTRTNPATMSGGGGVGTSSQLRKSSKAGSKPRRSRTGQFERWARIAETNERKSDIPAPRSASSSNLSPTSSRNPSAARTLAKAGSATARSRTSPKRVAPAARPSAIGSSRPETAGKEDVR